MPLSGQRYYDDNGWVALAALQDHRITGSRQSLALAERLARFLGTGRRRGGGFRWVEGGEALHACSTGAAALVLSMLGRDVEEDLWFLAGLRREDGVVADHLRADGSRDEAAFSYNQGLFIALAHQTGNRRLLAEAVQAGAAYYTADRLWRQPVAFNAIYARCLARADAPLGAVAEYADRLWSQGRDADGWFTRAGRYDQGRLLDTAGAAQLFVIVDEPERAGQIV
jgi:predicted alpha-1,6-mannanase (GH76 family)